MMERRPLLGPLGHVVLLLGAGFLCLPLWAALIAPTHASIPAGAAAFLPGEAGLGAYRAVFEAGAGDRLIASALIAGGIALAKLALALMAAFAVVFFRFPFRVLAFWAIFATVMLPLEMRMGETVALAVRFDLAGTMPGLILPLSASAIALFLFRQLFMTVPDSLVDAAKLDGIGPLRFFGAVILPMSRWNVIVLGLSLFVYGWNQYLWPLLATDAGSETAVMALGTEAIGPGWGTAMALTVTAMLPPIVIVLSLQRFAIRRITDQEA